jgi:predicted transcriptional regulator
MAATIRLSQQHSCSLDHLIRAQDKTSRNLIEEAILVKPVSPSIENKASPKKPEFDDEISF